MMLVFIFLLLSILLVDLYGYYGLRTLLRAPRLQRFRRPLLRIYWAVDVLFLLLSIAWALIIRNSAWPDYVQYRNYFYITGAFMLIFLPKFTFLVFIILDDLRKLIVWALQRLSGKIRSFSGKAGRARSSLLLPKAGGILSVLMFFWVLYGVAYGRFNFRVDAVEIHFETLPDAFDGYRIAHFSDTHLGSFARTRPVIRGLEKISDLQADLVIFSGDMVNNEAAEAEPYIRHFSNIASRDGKFTVLGNHDMGDYRRWYTIEEKEANLQQLEAMKAAMDFTLLRNEHVFIVRGTDSLMLLGIDNWGLPPFAQYGDLQQALGPSHDFPFQMLISHDPSHWRAEVIPATNIQLMLAGHTHGMQMGIRTPWFSWSPSVYKYPEWNGTYREGQQVLYVNRGFGYLGFPGRMGMPPEITLITLRKGQGAESRGQ